MSTIRNFENTINNAYSKLIPKSVRVKSDNFYKYQKFRKQFKKFSFENYEFRRLADTLEIAYNFNLDNIYYFRPVYTIPLKSAVNDKLTEKELSGIIFYIGMIELISYWKAACPKIVVIKPFALNEDQKNWWKNIYFQGLGEFFFLNSISASEDDFMNIIAESDDVSEKMLFKLDDSNIIPVGGGKDSTVTIELHSDTKEKNLLFILNPRKACNDTAETAGYNVDQVIEIKRTIDPVLLKMNDEGFLNGHTPFSALLAFVSLLAAAVTGKRNILLSNESSANESTVSGSKVNHQYSKSYEFEKDFREYVDKYISSDFNYFSFLRPINELQIAKLFSQFPKYHHVFRSCNAGSKTDSWCGECPKCLFTAIILSPFISRSELTDIFGKNILDDPKLLFYFKQLYGEEETKPFECVGTIDDVNVALVMVVKKYNENIPFLLKHYRESEEYKKYSMVDPAVLLKQFNSEHFLEKYFEEILKSRFDD
jgi:UDP-N-acetyl-alpha-D-muramoyl-L-alanyl-L-glutamate epimerase